MSQYNLNNNQTINNIPSGDNTLNNLNLNTYSNQNLENNQSTTDLNNKDSLFMKGPIIYMNCIRINLQLIL